ncbi:alpha/beta hydrolase [Curtanaerobium respiraculi]|uniref:alpha/beta hydrolase n=1 Tax=Curtanaerobium respiraculi TaxID=2949669 RepID=UPI0024B3999B|nr:hypothetical protein [Curtanaerobium respiraculi]
MLEPIAETIDGKLVTVYPSTHAPAPIVFSNDYVENGEGVLAHCAAEGSGPFHLVTISQMRWDEDLSPWAADPVVSEEDHFTGEAKRHLGWMLDAVAPFAEDALGCQPAEKIIAGYSMAGLFALYASYLTDVFDGAVCVSGSVWFPGFLDFCRAHAFPKNPLAIYLSLGDRESASRNAVLRTTQRAMEQLRDEFGSRHIPTVFELNPGNHFHDMDLRMAKGIGWILRAMSA